MTGQLMSTSKAKHHHHRRQVPRDEAEAVLPLVGAEAEAAVVEHVAVEAAVVALLRPGAVEEESLEE